MFAFAVFFALLGVTTLIFRGIGRERALALGLMVSQRNMGLMVAATDGALPGTTWLYFALCQFPIYLSPQLLKPIVERFSAQRAASAVAEPPNPRQDGRKARRVGRSRRSWGFCRYDGPRHRTAPHPAEPAG